MKNRLRRLALAAVVAVAGSTQAADYLIGMSKVDITPTVPMRAFGYPPNERMCEAGPYPGDGLGLTIRAIYIARPDGSDPIVLVAADLVNFAPFDTEFARDPDNYNPAIPGLTRDRVMINLTHTHHAPSSSESSVRVMAPVWMIDADPQSAWRSQTLRPKLRDAIALAYADREPANLWFHRNKISIGVNRRTGSAADLTDATGTALASSNGYDQTLDVIEVYRDDISRKGVVFFYGAHPVTLPIFTFPDGKLYHHPDYVGVARKTIEDATPQNDIAIFFQAAGGDVNALPHNGTYANTVATGNTLATRVLQMMAETATPANVITAQIRPSQGGITAYSRVWGAPLQTAAGIDRLGGFVHGEPRGMATRAPGPGQPATGDWLRWADRYCEGVTGHGGGNPRCSLRSGVMPDRSWDVEMQTVSVGRWRIAGLSHEPVGMQGLKVRQRWPEDWVSMMGYLGRTQNYLATSAQVDNDESCGCGYEGFIAEVWNGHPAPWATYAATAGRYDIDEELRHVLYDAPHRVNYALAWNGATATATSQLDGDRPPAAAINGDRLGLHWGSDPATGSGWHSQTAGHFPETLEVDFHADRTIDRIDVFSVQDTFWSPSTPTEQMVFTAYGLVDFTVQYWSGGAWVTVKNGNVTGNNKVWKTFAFAPVTTTKIRVTVTAGAGSYARITEVEAWGNSTSRPNVALASRGATAQASSTFNANRAPAAAINGDRRGIHWGIDPSTGSGWHSQTAGHFPEWLEVVFAAPQKNNEGKVFPVQDTFSNPAEPTETMTFNSYGVIDFNVEYWDSTAAQWTVVPGGNVVNNQLVWRKLTFLPITTSRIRVVVLSGGTQYARIVEVEALTPYDFLSSVTP